MGRAKSTAQVLGGNAHKGDATTERQGRYPVVAMQNMMLRLRKVKNDPGFHVKRFSLYDSMVCLSLNRDILFSALHSGDRATAQSLRAR
jgi:hypothetical protein